MDVGGVRAFGRRRGTEHWLGCFHRERFAGGERDEQERGRKRGCGCKRWRGCKCGRWRKRGRGRWRERGGGDWRRDRRGTDQRSSVAKPLYSGGPVRLSALVRK